MQRQRSFEEELRHVSQQIAQPPYEITISTKNEAVSFFVLISQESN